MIRFAPNVSSRSHALAALAAVGALATIALLAQPASAAQSTSDVPEATVQYSFSDLATDAGTRALYRRITRAAKAVCPEYDLRDLKAESVSEECQRQAVARAVRQIGSQHLAAVYARAHARRG